MSKKRTFVSFDYDHDLDLKILLVGQSKNPDTPFEIADFSLKEAISTNWKEKARARIKSCDIVIVICGEHTDSATGVSAELTIAQEEEVPYFLLYGRAGKRCMKPKSAKYSDVMYEWKWAYLRSLLNGKR